MLRLSIPFSIVLSAASGGISIASFAIAGANFSFSYSITSGIVKKLLKTKRNKQKKHNKIVMLAKSKLHSIENTISEELIANKIITS